MSARVRVATATAHRVLLDAPGVREAAEAVEAAEAALPGLREARLQAHYAWRDVRRKNALKPGFDPGPEPNPEVGFEERQAFEATLVAARSRLEGAVDAAADDVVEAARVREAELMEEARGALAVLGACASELGSLGRALGEVAAAQHQPAGRQPAVNLDQLLWLLRSHADSDAVLDFQDGRTLWLQATGYR